MELEYIEDLINKENINLINTYIENTSGAYFNYKNINVIIYDPSKSNSSIEKKQILAEELGHYYYDATYKFNSDITFIEKQEYKSKKFAYNILIPFTKLKQLIQNGINNIYALAEYFNVTIEYMYNAIQFYINKYGDFTKEVLDY